MVRIEPRTLPAIEPISAGSANTGATTNTAKVSATPTPIHTRQISHIRPLVLVFSSLPLMPVSVWVLSAPSGLVGGPGWLLTVATTASTQEPATTHPPAPWVGINATTP